MGAKLREVYVLMEWDGYQELDGYHEWDEGWCWTEGKAIGIFDDILDAQIALSNLRPFFLGEFTIEMRLILDTIENRKDIEEINSKNKERYN